MSTASESAKENSASGVSLDFDAWADLSTRLLERDEEARLEILAAAELLPDEWDRCNEHWSLEVARDVARGRMDRAMAYGVKCADELKRRKAAPALESANAEPAQLSSSSGERSPEPPSVEPIAPIAPIVPVVPVAPIVPIVPVAPVTSAAPSEPIAPPPPMMPVVPIAPPPSMTPVVRVAPPPSTEATDAALGSTPPGPLAGRSKMVTVTAAFQAPVVSDQPLPFQKTASPEFLAIISAPPSPPSPEAKRGMGETVPADLVSPLAAPLPFSSSLPQLTLQSYASLHAELSVSPANAGEILRRYGVADEATRRALDDAWRARLAASPRTQAEWQRLYNEYREWLLQQQKR